MRSYGTLSIPEGICMHNKIKILVTVTSLMAFAILGISVLRNNRSADESIMIVDEANESISLMNDKANQDILDKEIQNKEIQNKEIQNTEVKNAEVKNAEVTNAEVQNKKTQNDLLSYAATETEKIFVHVCGEVMKPGVYCLKQGCRLYEAIELAGGFTIEADFNYLNQAEYLLDGMKIYIPSIDEVKDYDNMSNPITVSNKDSVNLIDKNDIKEENTGKININTADRAKLMTLPGIGSAKADAIIKYRQDNGGFEAIEDIMNITGIKEKMFSKIKSLICV